MFFFFQKFNFITFFHDIKTNKTLNKNCSMFGVMVQNSVLGCNKKMISYFVNKMNQIVHSNLIRNVKSCRSYFSNSQNGLRYDKLIHILFFSLFRFFFIHATTSVLIFLMFREFNYQLSKFNGNDGDYESKINAARLIALAIQCDDKLSFSNRYLSERNREVGFHMSTFCK